MNHVIPIAGFCAPQFSAVSQAFAANFHHFADIGGAVAIYHHQKPVVDLWGGYTDAERSKLWQQNTIVNVWSVTKAVIALCALRLVDRGELDLDAPVAHYWPDFAQAGKGQLFVRQLLNHQAGLAAIAEPLPTAAIFD
ncbi:MAG: class A beta-lactamase-related serine hydrolase [Caldilinea sp. CFX5]|nr:class A beta-lactamase-related serine hydrolase [Caldilinea sp. CFX5]